MKFIHDLPVYFLLVYLYIKIISWDCPFYWPEFLVGSAGCLAAGEEQPGSGEGQSAAATVSRSTAKRHAPETDHQVRYIELLDYFFRS